MSERIKILGIFVVLGFVAGIFASAFMTIKSMKEERQIDESFIEDEGKVYIERIEEERKKRAITEEAN